MIRLLACLCLPLIFPAGAEDYLVSEKDSSAEPIKITITDGGEVRLGGKTYIFKRATPNTTESAARKIIIPMFEVYGTTIEEALDFLRFRSLELDPGRKGLNFILSGEGTVEIPELNLRNASIHSILGAFVEQTDVQIQYTDEAIIVRKPK